MTQPTQFFAAQITERISFKLAVLGPAMVEARLVRGVPLRVSLAFGGGNLRALRGNVPNDLTPEEFLTRWTRVVAAGFIGTPAPTVEASWLAGEVFKVEVSWDPERKPWGGIVVPSGIPREGPLGKSPDLG